MNFFKSRAFFRVRLVVYGAAIAYFGVQALRAYQAKSDALQRADQATQSQSSSEAGGAGMPAGTKKTVTLPNGETIEYMEYELTEAEAAKLQASGRFEPGDAPAPEAKPNPEPAPAPAPAPAPGN